MDMKERWNKDMDMKVRWNMNIDVKVWWKMKERWNMNMKDHDGRPQPFISCLVEALRRRPHLGGLPALAGMLFWVGAVVFTLTAAVQVLHEPEEGQLIEEDL